MKRKKTYIFSIQKNNKEEIVMKTKRIQRSHSKTDSKNHHRKPKRKYFSDSNSALK